MLRVYKWTGILDNVLTLLSSLTTKWKTRLEIWKDRKKIISSRIDITRGFLQGDSYSPVGFFCIYEIPVCKLLQESKGYRMRQSGKRDVKHTYSLFLNHLKTYQESHKTLKDIQASNDTGRCYGVT